MGQPTRPAGATSSPSYVADRKGAKNSSDYHVQQPLSKQYLLWPPALATVCDFVTLICYVDNLSGEWRRTCWWGRIASRRARWSGCYKDSWCDAYSVRAVRYHNLGDDWLAAERTGARIQQKPLVISELAQHRHQQHVASVQGTWNCNWQWKPPFVGFPRSRKMY